MKQLTTQEEEDLIKLLSAISPMDYDRILSEVDRNRQKWNAMPYFFSHQNPKLK
jgi:hypothetical protein